jgi:hypothetical protein
LLPTSASGFAYSTFANNVPRITSGLGLLVEEIRTNLLLNSTVPATQTTGSLANATYTLWVNGAGSATMSAGTATGCGTGVATQGSPVNFTTSGAAGTCTVTVSGALNAFQLEAGAFGTSLIVTAGATVARAADSIVAAKPPVVGPAYTQFAKGTPNAPTTFGTAQNLLQADTGAVGQRVLIRRQNATGGLLVTMVGGSGSAFTPSGTWAQGASGKVAAAAAAGSQAASFNGGTIASNTGATMPTTPTVLRIGSSSGTTEFWNGYVERVALWAVPRLSSADMQRISGP